MPFARTGIAADELRVLQDPSAASRDHVGERLAVAMAVDVAVARAEQSAGKVVAGHVRDEPSEPVPIEDAAVGHAELVLDLDAALERLEVGVAMTEAEVAVAHDLEGARALEGREGAHALDADRDGERVEVLRLDDPDRQTRRRAGDPAALDDGDVGDAALGQVVGRRQAERAGSDDDDRWAGGHGILPAGAIPR